jgi:hypothetical protein
MADKKKKPVKKPDGRGKRPRDPNELAKWIVDQSTSDIPECDQSKTQKKPTAK